MAASPDLIVEEPSWQLHSYIDETLIAQVLDKVIQRFPNISKKERIEIAVLHSNDEKLQQLNSEFRGINKPTNVLSFPDQDLDYKNIHLWAPEEEELYLGDIAISYQTMVKEASNANISLRDHYIHLLVHSILHLLGYDHIKDEDAEIMEKLEAEILAEFNIDSPY